ncbi:WSC domain-containing protein [Mycena rebaudengoi]|nr:WSC domain-containing protein [Mycena rebaudengoi]
MTTSFFSMVALLLPQVVVGLTVQTRQVALPGTWGAQGCFTDVSSSRTLLGSSTAGADMTIEKCLAFCDTGGFGFAGVEFGSECYCDHAPQDSGLPVELSECNVPCAGDATEFCGAGNRLNLIWDGSALPTITLAVDTWQYTGCFSDSINPRTLPHNIATADGKVTVESCTTACNANGFAVAGVEFGTECWCSNSLPTAPALADEKCRMACVANTTEFCGGSGALMVYQDTAGQLCLSSTRAGDFNLEAVFVDAPETGPASVPLHVIMVNTIIKLSWSILSTASGVFTSEELTAGGLLPKSTSQPQFRTTSLPLVSGGSPTFATSQFPPPAAAAYCVMNNPQLGPSGPQVLAGNSRSDLFALCPNTTANGRVDVVFDPVLNHPHYTKANCQSVYLAFVAV